VGDAVCAGDLAAVRPSAGPMLLEMARRAAAMPAGLAEIASPGTPV
jgi:hypothetical protein